MEQEIIILKKSDIKSSFPNKNIESDPFDIEVKNENKKRDIQENELKTLEDFENYYLENNVFIYPDSIPYREYRLGENFEISDGERDFRNKYKNDILMPDKNTSGFKKKIFY